MDYSANNGGRHSRMWLYSAIGTGIALFVILRLFSSPTTGPLQATYTVKSAVALLNGDSGVSGTVFFKQASASAPVVVSGAVRGLDANALRGFHVHALGDLTKGCVSAGSHFNPFAKTHGAPTDTERHVGDLGNIQTNASGVAVLDIVDKQLTLNGPLSIVGRSVVVHLGTDDLGKGGDEESLKTGNAGGRGACGTIGIAELA